MSILNDLFNAGTLGESNRLDFVVRECDRLQTQFNQLVALLAEKNLLTPADLDRLRAADAPSGTQDEPPSV
jgi:hypothetical protein